MGCTLIFWGSEYGGSYWQHSNTDKGIWDLSMVYLPELLERVSAGEVEKADNNLSIRIQFTVLFLMVYNNKKMFAIFGCYVTTCGQNKHLWFSKFPI